MCAVASETLFELQSPKNLAGTTEMECTDFLWLALIFYVFVEINLR